MGIRVLQGAIRSIGQRASISPSKSRQGFEFAFVRPVEYPQVSIQCDDKLAYSKGSRIRWRYELIARRNLTYRPMTSKISTATLEGRGGL